MRSGKLPYILLVSVRAFCSSMSAISLHASARNKLPILDVLRPIVDKSQQETSSPTVRLLEVASGTGEHAGYFAENIPSLIIQPTEPNTEMHSSISAWSEGHSIRVASPIALDVLDYQSNEPLPEPLETSFDLVLCINMMHISPWETTSALFQIASRCLRPGGYVFLYGPYREHGTMVESNQQFDKSLRGRDPSWGIRDRESVEETGARAGFTLYQRVEMPSNNLSLIFTKGNLGDI
mmetsp:Transcript_33723/g.34352  ORF Transcript_33723/g.34352 Transcript_33723/m.34352 type:complete len:237 (-) Transcript_33723:114-824(-)